MIIYRFCCLAMLMLAPGLAQATTYYVSTTGNNANSGTDESSPFATLKHAATVFNPGDTILVRGGTYNLANGSTIIVTKVGTAGSPLVIKNYPGERPILNWPDKNNTANRILFGGSLAAWITIEGFEIRNGYEGGKCNTSCNNITFRYNWIHDNRNQGFLGQNTNGLFEYNIFEHNGNFETCVSCSFEHGIYANGNDMVIRYNVFINNLAYGIQQAGTTAQSNRWTIVGNTFAYEAYRAAIVVWGANTDDTRIENNIFYENGINLASGTTVHGVDCSSCGGITGLIIRNNHSYASGSGATLFKSSNLPAHTDSGNVHNVSPPSFVNGGSNALPVSPDFRIAATSSPTINMGLAQAGRISCGSSVDAGAYEMPTVTGASITGNQLDVTVCVSTAPMKLGTWTVGCTGTNCGSRTVTNKSITGGGLVRLTVSGAACEAGQTWTVSAANDNTDSANLGGFQNQLIPTVTNFSVNSSGCTGGGGPPPPPASQTAEYNFENNLNDASGNGNHAVGSANISYFASKDGLGVQFGGGTQSYVDTGLLNGYNPSANHLVVAFGIRVSALGLRRNVAGVDIGTDQRFYIRRDIDNTWQFAVQSNGSPVATEFPVVAGDQHVCVKFNPTTDTATLYVNGQAGVLNGASVQSYTSYTFPSTFRWGLPSSIFVIPPTWTDIIDQAFVYDTDVSCTDIYAAWEPPTPPPPTGSVTQAAHQWQGVYLAGGISENRGAINEQRTVNKGGAAALVIQLNCTGGACDIINPRFRYNINGGAFNSVIPASPTADGISMWGPDSNTELNDGLADGPLGSTPGTHSDGVWVKEATLIPSVNMGDDTSYTIGATFRVNMPMSDPNNPPTVCIKVYDQSGAPLTSYNPSGGACLTQRNPTASGGP